MKFFLHNQSRLRQNLRAGLLALLLASSLPLLAQTKEQVLVLLSSPGKPGMLSVKLVGGSLNVMSYSGKDVVIEASARGERRGRSAEASDNASGMRRIDRNPAST